MVREETNPHAPAQARMTQTVYLRDILLDVARASGHPFAYVRDEMGWLTMWAIYDSVKRRRAALAEAAADNPMAALAFYTQWL